MRAVPRALPSWTFWAALAAIEALLWGAGRVWGTVIPAWDARTQQDGAAWVPHWSIALALYVVVPAAALTHLLARWLRAERARDSRPAV